MIKTYQREEYKISSIPDLSKHELEKGNAMLVQLVKRNENKKFSKQQFQQMIN